jgi:hypothetical protein
MLWWRWWGFFEVEVHELHPRGENLTQTDEVEIKLFPKHVEHAAKIGNPGVQPVLALLKLI